MKTNQTNEPSTLTVPELPHRCFISYSYQDSAAIKSLLHMLPRDVEPITFPRRDPDPSRAVSNSIIPTILECPGLIYLTRGASQHSFWVSFERDYGLRSKRAVFAYDPNERQLRPDTSAPIPLDMAVVSHAGDVGRVDQLLSWMADERHFDINRSRLRSRFGGFSGDIMVIMEEILTIGGVVLWLLSSGSEAIAREFYSDEFLEYLRYRSDYDLGSLIDDDSRKGDDDLGEGEQDDDLYRYRKLYDNVYSVFARIDPAWKPSEIGECIDLYEGVADGESFDWNRVDDLIIRLYARVLEKTVASASGSVPDQS